MAIILAIIITGSVGIPLGYYAMTQSRTLDPTYLLLAIPPPRSPITGQKMWT